MKKKIITAGVDEVGRGCLAGPVISAAVILKQGINLKLLRDSKKISFKKRQEISDHIKLHSIYAIGVASVNEILDLNILQASLLSMKRAVEKLPVKPTIKPKQKIKKTVEKNIDKKPFKRPTNKIKRKNRSSSSQAILRNLAEANEINQKKDIVNQIKESLKNQNQNLNVTEENKATATEIDILRNHVRQCWNAPYAANELNKIINLKIFTNPDGSVVNVQIIDVAFYKKDPVYRAAADSARRAVKDCSPLPLPKNKYDLFKIFTFNFDTSFING